MDVCCSQALNGRLLRGQGQSEWIAPHFVVGVSVYPCTYVRPCECVSHQTDPLGASDGPEVPRSSHAHWHQAASSCTHSLSRSSLFLTLTLSSSSPLLFILLLPSPLLPLSSHFVFSWFSAWPHLWENNYQMGTPCFNSDFEVNNSITTRHLPMLLFPYISVWWYCFRSKHCNPSLTEELARHPPCTASWNIVSMQWCFRVVIAENVAWCWRMPAY